MRESGKFGCVRSCTREVAAHQFKHGCEAVTSREAGTAPARLVRPERVSDRSRSDRPIAGPRTRARWLASGPQREPRTRSLLVAAADAGLADDLDELSLASAVRYQRRRKRSSSSSRPTSGVSARASKRRPPLARKTQNSDVVGSGAPFSPCARPRSESLRARPERALRFGRKRTNDHRVGARPRVRY